MSKSALDYAAEAVYKAGEAETDAITDLLCVAYKQAFGSWPPRKLENALYEAVKWNR